jgi:hypothetical protein
MVHQVYEPCLGRVDVHPDLLAGFPDECGGR